MTTFVPLLYPPIGKVVYPFYRDTTLLYLWYHQLYIVYNPPQHVFNNPFNCYYTTPLVMHTHILWGGTLWVSVKSSVESMSLPGFWLAVNFPFIQTGANSWLFDVTFDFDNSPISALAVWKDAKKVDKNVYWLWPITAPAHITSSCVCRWDDA